MVEETAESAGPEAIQESVKPKVGPSVKAACYVLRDRHTIYKNS